ncbi:MAG: hypothetical protein PHG53_09510 [Phycisphaerae bacterium]|nr:hypothetical protein [Phycisphaerae bacterium]
MSEEVKHWTQEFNHEKLATPEAKEAFTKAMHDYATPEEAIIGGYEAKKIVGRKMPESLDEVEKWEQKDRDNFKSWLQKVNGAVGDIKDLEDLNIKDGLPENLQTSDEMITEFKKFVVDEKIPKAKAQKLVTFYNNAMSKAAQQIETMIATQKKADEDAFHAKQIATNDALIAVEGTKEKVAEKSELVRRMFANVITKTLKLTDKEIEQSSSELVSSGITTNPVLCRVLFHLAEITEGQGTHEGGGGVENKPVLSQYEQNKQRWPKSPQLWGDPNK